MAGATGKAEASTDDGLGDAVVARDGEEGAAACGTRFL
jgi:hypothetical protein